MRPFFFFADPSFPAAALVGPLFVPSAALGFGVWRAASEEFHRHQKGNATGRTLDQPAIPKKAPNATMTAPIRRQTRSAMALAQLPARNQGPMADETNIRDFVHERFNRLDEKLRGPGHDKSASFVSRGQGHRAGASDQSN